MTTIQPVDSSELAFFYSEFLRHHLATIRSADPSLHYTRCAACLDWSHVDTPHYVSVFVGGGQMQPFHICAGCMSQGWEKVRVAAYPYVVGQNAEVAL